MMMNGWKTAKEIIDDYQLAGKDFSKLADECAKSSKYKDAVVMMHGSTGRIYVYVVEQKWQQFLLAKSLGILNQEERSTNEVPLRPVESNKKNKHMRAQA